MSNFIANMGYTLMWAFGVPEYSFEEAFEQYYTVGLILLIVGIICITILPILIILYTRKVRKK